MKLQINFQVSREHAGRPRTEYRNGKLEIDGDWNDANLHAEVTRQIRALFPDWEVTGYALATQAAPDETKGDEPQ